MATATQRPVRARRVSTKVAENQDIEATQAQLAAKAVIDAFQPVIQALTAFGHNQYLSIYLFLAQQPSKILKYSIFLLSCVSLSRLLDLRSHI
jgi:hypothetical protein